MAEAPDPFIRGNTMVHDPVADYFRDCAAVEADARVAVRCEEVMWSGLNVILRSGDSKLTTVTNGIEGVILRTPEIGYATHDSDGRNELRGSTYLSAQIFLEGSGIRRPDFSGRPTNLLLYGRSFDNPDNPRPLFRLTNGSITRFGTVGWVTGLHSELNHLQWITDETYRALNPASPREKEEKIQQLRADSARRAAARLSLVS